MLSKGLVDHLHGASNNHQSAGLPSKMLPTTLSCVMAQVFGPMCSKIEALFQLKRVVTTQQYYNVKA